MSCHLLTNHVRFSKCKDSSSRSSSHSSWFRQLGRLDSWSHQLCCCCPDSWCRQLCLDSWCRQLCLNCWFHQLYYLINCLETS